MNARTYKESGKLAQQQETAKINSEVYRVTVDCVEYYMLHKKNIEYREKNGLRIGLRKENVQDYCTLSLSTLILKNVTIK